MPLRSLLPWVVLLCAVACGAAGSIDKAELSARLDGAEASFRAKWGGLTVEELSPAEVPDEENRARLVIDAALAIDEGAEPMERVIGSWIDDGERLDRELVRRRVDPIEASLVRFDEALGRVAAVEQLERSSYGVDYTTAARSTSVGTLRFVDLAHLLTARGLLAAERGQQDLLLADARRLFVIADSFAGEPDAVLQMVRGLYRLSALHLVREALASSLAPAELEELQRLAEAGAEPDPAEQHFRGELLFSLYLIEQASEQLAEGDADAERSVLEARLWWIDYVDRWFEYGRRDVVDRGATPEYVVLYEKPKSDFEKEMAWATAVMEEMWTKSVERRDLSAARRQVAVAAIAVERFAADHGGALPESLDELVPSYLEAPPLDPYTNEPVAYARSGDGYRLVASEAAVAAWEGRPDPVLDWSREIAR